MVGAAAAFLHWDALVAAALTWIGSATYGYGMLVPPVVAFLLWQRRAALRQMAPRPWPWGLALIGAAALLATVGQVISALVVEQLAFVALLQAAALAILGPAVFRQIAFPLLYLYLAVPLGDGLIAPLQALTAAFAVGLLEALGVPVRLDGLLIRIPGATFHVAEACAGLRFLLASFALGVLLAALFFRTWWHRCVRARRDRALDRRQRPARGRAGADRAPERPAARHRRRSSDLWLRVHRPPARRPGGARGRARDAGRIRRRSRRRGAAAAPAKAPHGRILATAAAAVLATALPALAARPAADACRATPGVAAPEIAPPWTPVASPERRATGRGQSGCRGLAALSIGRSRRRSVRRLLLRAARGRRGGEPGASTERGRPGTGAGSPGRGAGQLPVQRLEVRSGAETRLVYLWYWVDGRFTADPLVAKLRQAKAALLGGPDAAAVIVLSSPYDAEPASARATIQQALVALEPLPGFLMRLGGAAEASARP